MPPFAPNASHFSTFLPLVTPISLITCHAPNKDTPLCGHTPFRTRQERGHNKNKVDTKLWSEARSSWKAALNKDIFGRYHENFGNHDQAWLISGSMLVLLCLLMSRRATTCWWALGPCRPKPRKPWAMSCLPTWNLQWSYVRGKDIKKDHVTPIFFECFSLNCFCSGKHGIKRPQKENVMLITANEFPEVDWAGHVDRKIQLTALIWISIFNTNNDFVYLLYCFNQSDWYGNTRETDLNQDKRKGVLINQQQNFEVKSKEKT